jgi:hypothetical protein
MAGQDLQEKARSDPMPATFPARMDSFSFQDICSVKNQRKSQTTAIYPREL